jgi:adenine-specific DNA-methyltransferase
MSTRQTRLELAWIGRENRPRLEPRVLVEDPSKSYHAKARWGEADLVDNRLIFAD